ncbi:MAG: M23 family metallopeptidase [Solirubrobacteraceae bacterium]
MSRRTIFVGAIVVILLMGPVIALLSGGESGVSRGKAADGAPVASDYADVARSGDGGADERPLPKSRPQVSESVAGETAAQAAAQGAGVQIEGPRPTGPATADGGVSPGAPSDDEVREDLVAQQKAQKAVRAALASGRYPVSFGSGRLSWPLPAAYTTVSSPFGPRGGRLHAGIDIPAPIGTPIRAADTGTVVIAGSTGGYGNYTCIQHTKSLSTCYAHQSRILVSPGEDVKKGQLIGQVGNTGNSTGPHLHFETRIGGKPINPVGFF